MAKRPVLFYCPHNLSGGVRVVCELVSRLVVRGWPAEFWWPGPPPSWFTARPVPFRGFGSLRALGDAARATRAVKVATYWVTASWVAETLREDDKGLYLVQDRETVYAATTAQEHDILRTYALGLQPVTVSRWVTDWLREECGQEAHHLGCGIDHAIFRHSPMLLRDRNRIFAPYRPNAGPNDLKGWGTVKKVVELVRAKNAAASLVTFGCHGAPTDVPAGTPHIHLENASDYQLRHAYCQSGVFLMPSRHEGLCLTNLEAMACGAPVVTTDAEGNREYSRHEDTVMMGQTPEELAGFVGRLQADHAFADALGERGRQEALRYEWGPVVDRFEAVLEGL